MPNLVNAYVIYNGTNDQYVGGQGITISINCERLQAFSPRPVWLTRILAPGDGTIILYEPTFAPTSQQLLDPNIIPGFWIEQDGQDVMIDVTTIAAFQQACDACCGSVPTIIANNYAGNVPSFVPLAAFFYCVTRADDGSAGAHDAVAADYVSLYINTMRLKSNTSGISVYTFQSFYLVSQLPAIGTDVIAQC